MSQSKTEPFLKRVLKDPLFHFLIIGGLLFALSPFWNSASNRKEEIFISKAGQKHLADLFEITWQRPPTVDELRNLTEEHIKEEVYYREALALGLDDNDTIVRRRMRQKLEFMQEDLTNTSQPSTDTLRAYYNANKDNYKTDRVLSFQQVLISTKVNDQSTLAKQTQQALTKLQDGTKPASLSRSALLPVSTNLETERSVINTFGKGFANQLSQLETGKWQGPVLSAFGAHMVYISLDQAAKPMTYEKALPKLVNDYNQARREEFAENYYKNLRKKYDIKVESLP